MMKTPNLHLEMNGQQIPTFFYGTAWKEDETPRLTFQALHAGFRAIDTANQRKHYFEEGVGVGLRKFIEAKGIQRSEIFLQTKFTFARGQDHRKPFKETDPFEQQVKDSFASSLKHLGVDYIDSLILHGPYRSEGIGDEDLESWQAMETFVAQEKVRFIGVSNISAGQLIELCEGVKIKPSFVQNRCYARQNWDEDVRRACKDYEIKYQGFSLLTANQKELSSPLVAGIAHLHSKTVPQIIFRFCQQLGMICLTGTNSPLHMKQDLDINDFELSPGEMKQIESEAF